MAADAGIFSQYLQPVKSVAAYRADMDQEESNALKLAAGRMQAQQAQQDFADGQTLRTATMEAAGDQNALVKALNAKGLYKQAQSIQASIQGAEKTAAEIAKNKAQTGSAEAQTSAAKFKLEQEKRAAAATRMATFKTPDEAIADLQAKIQSGEVTPEQGEQLAQSIPRDAAQFGQWQLGHLRSLLTPQQLIEQGTAKPVKESDGQVQFYRDMNPNSPTYGKVVDGTKSQLQASPEAVLTDARTRSEGAANRGVQMRGQNMTNDRFREANDLKGRELDMSGQPSNGGSVLGAPVPSVLPWANQSNSKDANKVKAAEQTRGAKEIEKDIDAARKEKDAAASAKRFIQLNENTNTGGLVDRVGITRGLQSLGSDYSEMESITAKLAPAMRVEGSGSTSDFDGKQFERATVGVDKPKATNTNIAKGVIARAQQAEEYADFRQTYLEQNGTLQGADRFWKDYANKNPIFDPTKEGTFELNKARKSWKEHFKSGKPAASPAGAGLSAEEAAELAELRRRLGK